MCPLNPADLEPLPTHSADILSLSTVFMRILQKQELMAAGEKYSVREGF